MTNPQNPNKNKEYAEQFYKEIREVYCPYFKESIAFNSKGLEHLKFNRKYHARPIQDQNVRFKLLYLAPQVIKLSHTIQGISKTKSFELVRSNARTEKILLPVSYFEFVAILEDVRVRVIVKQVSDGPKYFWSIIPFWKLDKNSKKKKMSYGDPEVD